MNRVFAAIRVSWRSSIAFASIGTALTTLVLLPLLDIAFDVLMGDDLQSPDLVSTAYAAAVIGLIVSISAGIVSASAKDRNLGIFFEIHVRRRFDPIYWLAISAIPTMLGIVTAFVAFVSVYVVSGQALAPRDLFLLVPTALAVGFFLGIAATGVGVGLPDPYLGTTLIGVFLPVAAGVIVPLNYAPSWIRHVATAIPGSRTVQAIHDRAITCSVVGVDVALSIVWALIGMVFVRVAVGRIRRGLKVSVV
ncbi:ABC transporter [Trueperella pyogenes]|uniref:ABC transporter n=1 Tax=Trueperella pyogenes TaxID=1661 RepID=UPI00345D50F0